MIQVAQAREIICQLNAGSEESTATSVLNQDVAEEIYNDICALNLQTQVENPLGEIMPPHTNISNASEIAESLKSFSVTCKEINRHDIAAKDLRKLFDNCRVSLIETDTQNTVDTGTDEFASAPVSDFCFAIINTLSDKPEMNEKEQLKHEMNSLLPKLF